MVMHQQRTQVKKMLALKQLENRIISTPTAYMPLVCHNNGI